MLKKKSSSTEKKRKHPQSEERHDGHKRRSAESNLAVRIDASYMLTLSLFTNTHTWCVPEVVFNKLLEAEVVSQSNVSAWFVLSANGSQWKHSLFTTFFFLI